MTLESSLDEPKITYDNTISTRVDDITKKMLSATAKTHDLTLGFVVRYVIQKGLVHLIFVTGEADPVLLEHPDMVASRMSLVETLLGHLVSEKTAKKIIALIQKDEFF